LAVDVVAGGQIIESASLQVATVPALVACKLHAIADRRDARAAKRESDALDLVRLVGEVVREPAHAESLRAAPHDLAALASTQISRWFVDDALRTSRLARLAGAELEPADIEALGQLWRSTVGAE
jgi:predicted nucleotidyltransferase